MATWDLNRFVKTLAYFGTIPIVSSIDWLQALLGSRPDPTVHFHLSKMTAILVLGDTSIKEQVRQQLQQTGYSVRSFDRPVQALQDAIAADPSLLEVAAIVCCTDSAPRDWQEAAQTSLIFDFRKPTVELGEVWGALDDVVMGGVSQSGFSLASAAALFSGQVSIENSGGFASVRTRNFEPAIDLSDFNGIELRVKGDGSRYKFMLRSETRWDGIAYCASFDTIADDWTTVQIPFTDLIPVFRAKTVREAGAIDSSTIRSMQLMLSKFEYDGALNPHFTPGFFQLQVESIAAYRSSIPLVFVTPAGVSSSSSAAIASRLSEQLRHLSTTN